MKAMITNSHRQQVDQMHWAEERQLKKERNVVKAALRNATQLLIARKLKLKEAQNPQKEEVNEDLSLNATVSKVKKARAVSPSRLKRSLKAGVNLLVVLRELIKLAERAKESRKEREVV